jgi:sulfur-carrier protein adenylyltransferase/sulfurtransferase
MENQRYNRQIILPEVGTSGQEKLGKAKVLIVGVGGLGSAVLPYLVAAGVGEIGIIDDDNLDISNLQRQVIYSTDAVGNSKVLEAKKMALSLNPLVKINTVAERLQPENAIILLEQYDIIVDATDNLSTKYLIDDACCVLKKPFVYGSVFKFEGQVSVFNFQNGPSYRCLFQNENNEAANCNESGVLGVSVGMIGMFQANEVLKMILGIGQVLSSKLLVYNMLKNEQQQFQFSATENANRGQLFFDNKYKSYNIQEIDADGAIAAINNANVVFLDVRNPDELPKIEIPNCLEIPLNVLEFNLAQLNPEKEFFIFCQAGIRSKIAVDILRKHKFVNVKSILGGATQLEAKFLKQTVTFSKA